MGIRPSGAAAQRGWDKLPILRPPREAPWRGALWRQAGTVFLHSCRFLYYPPLDKNGTALHCREGRFFRLLHEKRGLLGRLSGDKKGGQHWRRTVLYLNSDRRHWLLIVGDTAPQPFVSIQQQIAQQETSKPPNKGATPPVQRGATEPLPVTPSHPPLLPPHRDG